MTSIPINIICYNNYKYVALMILQLTSILVDPDIRIIDNGSNDALTIKYLENTEYPVSYMGNIGPTIWYYIYDDMPDLFVVTDADLVFNDDMPSTFLEDLTTISNRYQSWRTGLALRINDGGVMYQYYFDADYCGYPNVFQIWVSQAQYWTVQYEDPDGFEVYDSPVDTTFFLFNKNNPQNPPQPDARVAADYQLRVFSWYPDVDFYSEGGDIYSLGSVSRLHRYLAHINDYPDTFYAIRCFELKYLEDNNIVAVTKDVNSLGIWEGDESFTVNDLEHIPAEVLANQITHLVQLDLESTGADDFWQNVYPTDYNPVFDLFDIYMDPTKDYIDIGSWVGDTVIYPARNSKRVISVEADSRHGDRLTNLFALNLLETPLILEQSALYSSTEEELSFCQQDNPETDSTSSHLVASVDCTGVSVNVPSISFSDLLDKYSVTTVSMINVNINGDEENVLQDVYDYSSGNTVPLYVTFYYSVWNDPDLDRFTFLTSDQKTAIQSGVTSILF